MWVQKKGCWLFVSHGCVEYTVQPVEGGWAVFRYDPHDGRELNPGYVYRTAKFARADAEHDLYAPF